MSKRRNHTTMGLAFVLACLIIAFGIFLGLRSTTKDETNAVAVNEHVAEEAANLARSNTADDPNGPQAAVAANGAPEASFATGSSDADGSGAERQDPTQDAAEDTSVPDQQAFQNSCVESFAKNRMPVATCACMFDRIQSYGKMTAENTKLAFRLCRLESITAPDRFQHQYAPGTAEAADEGDGTQGDVSRQGLQEGPQL